MSIISAVMGAVAASDGYTTPTPTYTLTPEANTVNEGSALTFNVGGTYIGTTTLYWTIETNAGDFATTSGTVSVTVSSGSFSVTPTADATTEGAETFTVALRQGSITGTILVTSTAVTINDTSLTPAPTYTLTPAANISHVNEGSSLEFTVGGTNIIDGTYYWTVTNSGDFGTTSGSFSITSNSGSFTVTPTADFTTEGSENFTASIRSVSITGTVLQTSESILINDTSQPATYTLTPATTSTNEGSSLTFNVTGTYIVNDTYYWTIETNSGDFETTSGSFAITSNTGTFTVTPTNDFTAEGAETFTVAIRSTSTSGTILSTSTSVTINDTSAPPFSLEFVQGQVDYMDVAYSSDWVLNTNWTIEFWSKASTAGTNADYLTVMGQDYTDGNSIQITYRAGFRIQGNNRIADEPTPNVWTHVALVATAGAMTLYYNGVSQYTGGYWSLTNNINPIRIGALGPSNLQRFDGKLAMIRISNTNKYPTAFVPTTTYGVEADTLLLLGSDNPLLDSQSHVITNTGVTRSTDFPEVTEFTFTNAGFDYSVDGFAGTFPVLTLVRGGLYYFRTNVTSTHPIALRLSQGYSQTVPGTTRNDPISGVYGGNNTIIYQVPLDAPSSIVYQCVYHSGMIGTINITNP